MPYLSLNGAELYYEEQGEGQPVVFLHGLWMSSRFFRKQLPYFGQRYRTIMPDFRAHGRSAHVQRGHTVAGYARDLHSLIEDLRLENVVLVGWSMGCFVIWDYVKQFGTEHLKAAVFVDESASDFNKPDWSYGFIDFPGLVEVMQAVQTDRKAWIEDVMIPALFKDAPAEEDIAWMLEEITRMPEAIASAICFDQMVQDYRPVLGSVDVPALVCFGRHDRMLAFAGAEHLRDTMPKAQLVPFENSGHCPFLEEPERFNVEVDRFIRALG